MPNISENSAYMLLDFIEENFEMFKNSCILQGEDHNKIGRELADICGRDWEDE